MSITLTEFLLARIVEEEAAARAAQAHERALLEVKPTWSVAYAWAMMLNTPNGEGGGGSHNFQPGSPSPDRVLAGCEAKRRIVERAQEQRAAVPPHMIGDGDEYPEIVAEEYEEQVLPMLALPYADHPDYREEWRP